MINATCCCDDNNGIGLAVGGSGSPDSVDTNVPNLHLYYAELEDTCLPCEGNTIHGTIQIPYISSKDSALHTIPVGYCAAENTYTLNYFPEIQINQNSETGKYEINQGTSIVNINHTTGTGIYRGVTYFTFKDFIEKIKLLPKAKFKNHEFKPCDCFTDVLYPSSNKTEDENSIAEIQNLYCQYYKVGVNALHLNWKPSVYLGEHDSKVEGISACGPIHFESARRGYIQDCTSRPQSTQHARSIFLPKNFTETGISYSSFNFLKLWYGPNHDELPSNHPDYWPNATDITDAENVIIQGNSLQNPSYLDYTYMYRVLVSALSFSSMKYVLNQDKEYKKQPWEFYIKPPPFLIFSIYKDINLNVMRKSTLGEHRNPICCTLEEVPDPPVTFDSSYFDCNNNQISCVGTGVDLPELYKCESLDTTGTPPSIITAFNQPIVHKQSSTLKNKGLIYYAFGCIPEICYFKIPPVEPSVIIGRSCGDYEGGSSGKSCLCQDTYFYGGPLNPDGKRVCIPQIAYYDFTNFNFSLSNNYIIPFDMKRYERYHTILLPKPESFQDAPSNTLCTPVYTTSCSRDLLDLDYEDASVPYFWWNTNGGSIIINNLLAPNYSNEEKYQFIPNLNFRKGQIKKTTPFNRGGEKVCVRQCCGTQTETRCVQITKITISDLSNPNNNDIIIITPGNVTSCESSCLECPGCIYDFSSEYSNCDYVDDSSGGCKTLTTTERYCELRVIGETPNECKETTTDVCGNIIPICSANNISRTYDLLVDAETWLPNPFLFFNAPHSNYKDVLLKIAEAWSIKQKLVVSDTSNICYDKYPCILDSCWNDIYSFDKTDYLQSKITTLYGKNLEYGSLYLEIDQDPDIRWLSNDLISKPMGYESFFNNIELWPQAIPTKTNQTNAISNKDNKNYIIEILKNRKSLYPDDSFRVNTGPISNNDYEIYWSQRVVYELADTFQIEGRVISDIKNDYYTEGIPDLSYSKTKLNITKTGEILKEIIDQEYNLNWFDVSIQHIIKIID